MPYDPSNPLYNIPVPTPRNKVKRATAKLIAARPKVTTEKALEGYDYLRTNSNKLQYNNNMKASPIKEKYMYFFVDAELYHVHPWSLVGGPKLMSYLPLGDWERINVAQGRFIIEQGIKGEYDESSWYRVSEEFSKAYVYDTYPALIGPKNIVYSIFYKDKADETEQGTISFTGPGADRWKEIYKKSPPPDGVSLID